MKARARVRSQHGFTLSELLVACAVIAFVMAGLLTMLQSGQESYLRGSRQIEAQQNLRVAIDRMVDEIRNAGFCPTCETLPVTANCPNTPTVGNTTPVRGFAAILPDNTNPATKVTIQNDWDGSGAINTVSTVNYTVVGADGTPTTTQRGEQITYTYNAGTGTLTRQEVIIDATPVTLVTGITSLSFTYFDVGNPVNPNGNTTATSQCIRSVGISMTTQPSVQGQATMQGKILVTMGDTVRLRNRSN